MFKAKLYILCIASLCVKFCEIEVFVFFFFFFLFFSKIRHNIPMHSTGNRRFNGQQTFNDTHSHFTDCCCQIIFVVYLVCSWFWFTHDTIHSCTRGIWSEMNLPHMPERRNQIKTKTTTTTTNWKWWKQHRKEKIQIKLTNNDAWLNLHEMTNAK